MLLADNVASEAAFSVTDNPISSCLLKTSRIRVGDERGLEDQSGFLSGHFLLKAALVKGLSYGTGATTVALEGYQASATLLRQMSVMSCRR